MGKDGNMTLDDYRGWGRRKRGWEHGIRGWKRREKEKEQDWDIYARPTNEMLHRGSDRLINFKWWSWIRVQYTVKGSKPLCETY